MNARYRGRGVAGSVIVTVAIGCLSACGEDGPPQRGGSDVMYSEGAAQSNKVSVGVVGPSLDRSSAAPQELRVRVRVPQNHHGYLDEGDEGFFIPFEFSFDALQSHGATVDVVEQPEGEREKSVGATVLRGEGEFSFRVDGLSSADDALHAVLRYQICSDMTGVCYRPEEADFRVTAPDP